MMTMMMMKYRTGEVITAAVAHTRAVCVDSLRYTHTQPPLRNKGWRCSYVNNV